MILPILLVMVVLALIFMILAFVFDDLPAKMLCNMVSVIAWFSAAMGSTMIEIPYSSGTSVEVFVRTNPGIPWFFLMIGSLMIAYGWYALSKRGMLSGSPSR